MGIRWGNGIPSALRGTTAVYTNGYAARCVKPAVFPRRCSITLRHLPSDFSISTTDLFEAAYILGHHPTLYVYSHPPKVSDKARRRRQYAFVRRGDATQYEAFGGWLYELRLLPAGVYPHKKRRPMADQEKSKNHGAKHYGAVCNLGGVLKCMLPQTNP